MDVAVEFLLRLLDHHAVALVDWGDLRGKYASFLAACQAAGFLSRQPKVHPVPSCPRCGEGVPYQLDGRHLCNRCYSAIDERHLRCWEFDLVAFLCWLAAQLHLRGTVRRIDEHFWQIGTHEDPEGHCECFFSRSGLLSETAAAKLAAYRNAVVLYGLVRPKNAEELPITLVSLLSVLGLGDSLALYGGGHVLRSRPDVRFDPRSGSVSVGGTRLGEVPVGTREFYFLLCLSRRLDEFVPYEEIKGFVTKNTQTADTTEEATFCHRLKSRIKTRGWVPKIDLLIATTNKSSGYRLRARLGGTGES